MLWGGYKLILKCTIFCALLLSFLLLSTTFISCAGGAGSPKGSEAEGTALAIKLPDTSKALYDKEAIVSFTVTVSSGSFNSTKSANRGETMLFSNLPVGTYSVKAYGKTSTGNIAAKCETSVTIVAGETTTTTLHLSRIDHWTVTFLKEDGSELSTQDISDGYTATKPAAPTKTGATFLGWYTGTVSGSSVTYSSTAYDFSTAVTSDINLYAKWEMGAVSMKTGYNISTALKALGANSAPNKTFSASATPPDAGTEMQLLSDAGSEVEVKAWCEGTSIKYYAEGFTDSNLKIPLNANSSSMFSFCTNLTSIDMSGFDTSNVTTMYRMFYDCSALTSLDVSGFDTSNVTNMASMFDSCTALTSLDVSGFDTSNVTNMASMFSGCSALTSLDVSGFDTGNVTAMNEMFYICNALTSLDVSSFDTSNVTNMNKMFASCIHLTTIYASSSFVTTKISGTNGDNMFLNCMSLVGGAGTECDNNHDMYNYARIDGETVVTRGYFTAKP